MPAADFVKLLRPVNCAMAALGTFIGFSVASAGIAFGQEAGIAMLVAFLVCGGGMAVNDYFDRKVDKKLHPEKPIPSGRVKPKTALIYGLGLFLAASILAAFLLPTVAFAIAVSFTALLFLYSKFLSRAKYVGNLVVASGTAFTLVFGASLVGNYPTAVALAIAALFANLARELIKDLEDIEADRGNKITLPMLVSEGNVSVLIFVYYLLAIFMVYVPVVLLSFGKLAFVIIVSTGNLVFLYSFGLAAKKDYSRAQMLSKAAMLLILLGFLLGVV